jgi:magnesium transporter
MEDEHESVSVTDDQEAVAVLALKLRMIVVPVVDQQSRLIGAVPPEALFDILRAEHFEDLQRLAGITPHSAGPEMSLTSPLLERFSRRLPWLIIGLVASSIITLVMTGFEKTIEHNVAAAFFVPALVYIAGAIGSQAVSVSVRALSAGTVHIGKLIREEIGIGLGIGLVLGTISVPAVLFVFNDQALAMAVGGAVFFGGAVSAVVGFSLPWTFERMGFDPALGSGPI